MSWIDESVVLDFKLPDDIQSVADECERLDKCRDYGYKMPEEKVVNMLRSDEAIKASALNYLSTSEAA